MGVTTKLEVNAVLFCLFQMIRLVVEKNEKLIRRFPMMQVRNKALLSCLFHNHRQGFALDIRAVIPADDAQIAYLCHTILQQRNACFTIKSPCLWLVAVILIVAKTSIDRGFQSMKLLNYVLFHQRADAVVYDVSSYQYEFGLLSIDHVHPFLEVRTAVVITEMKIAKEYYLSTLLI